MPIKNIFNQSFEQVFPYLEEYLSALTPEKRTSYLKKLYTAFNYGVKALILKDLNLNNKNSFEKEYLTHGDKMLISYGLKVIPNFENKLNYLIAEVMDKFQQTIIFEERKI